MDDPLCNTGVGLYLWMAPYVTQVWDSCLCHYDSDGDGMTNGEELGDPDCVWTTGDQFLVPEYNLTHPGALQIHF